jgi:hypothetical protein
MGAAATILQTLSVQQIYHYSKEFSCKHLNALMRQVNFAQLEYLHHRYSKLYDAETGLSPQMLRVRDFLLPPVDNPGLSSRVPFTVFLEIVAEWRMLNAEERLKGLFKILDISDKGLVSASDIAFFLPSKPIRIDDRVKIKYETRAGVLRYKGPIKGQEGEWAGIELDTASGKNNGSIGKTVYFKCGDKKGTFVFILNVMRN